MLVVRLPDGMGSKNVLKRRLNGSVEARQSHNTGGNQTTAQAILNPPATLRIWPRHRISASRESVARSNRGSAAPMPE
jgi:hypothetical protein